MATLANYIKDTLKDQYSRKIKFIFEGPLIVRLSSDELNPMNQVELNHKINKFLKGKEVQENIITDTNLENGSIE